MKKQEIFIEYMKSQKETINRLAKSEMTEKEKILKELNQNMEDRELSVNIQEIKNKINFSCFVRNVFAEKSKILPIESRGRLGIR